MAVPPRDLALHIDACHLLARMGGPIALNMLSHERAMMATSRQRRPAHLATTDAQGAAFQKQCAEMIQSRTEVIELKAMSIPGNVLLGVPLLLGQSDYSRNELAPGPNRYASEIELLAKYVKAPPSPRATVPDVALAIEVLQIARELNLLASRQAPSSPDRGGIGAAFATSGVFTRGRFYGAYDMAVIQRLRDSLRVAGVNTPDTDILPSLTRTFIAAWLPVFRELHAGAKVHPSLRKLLQMGDLLETAGFMLGSATTLDLIAKLTDRLWIGEDELLARIDAVERPGASGWLADLCFDLPSAFGSNTSLAVDRPIARRGKQLLLVAPHRINTDSTDLIDRLWSKRYKEKYYRQRGKVVEQIAYEMLSSIPGANGVQGGEYRSVDGSVLGECDGVVEVNGTLFIIEAKGGFISSAARSGSPEAAKSDIRDTVSEAYYQAGRLVSVLLNDGHVNLRSRSETMDVDLADVTRVHIVIPTADDMAAIATNPQELARDGFLPAGAVPTIIAAQDLLKLRDLLPDALDRIAYFAFREEALSTSPPLLLTDESEILGGYISGVDFVSKVEGLENRDEFGMVAPDVMLQRHVDVWLAKKYEDHANIPPPRRHKKIPAQRIGELAFSDFAGAIDATLASRGASEFALSSRSASSGRIVENQEISVILSQGLVRRSRLARDPDVRRLKRRSWQVWTVSCDRGGSRSLSAVVRNPRCAPMEFKLASCASRASFIEWVAGFETRRRRPPDVAVVLALEDIGVSRGLARGLARRGLGDLVVACQERGANAAKVAAVCLGPLAPSLNGDDWRLSFDSVVRAIGLALAKRLPAQSAASLLDRVLISGKLPEDCLDEQDGSEVVGIDIEEALTVSFLGHSDEADRAAAGDERALRFLAGQASRLLGVNRPAFGLLIQRTAEFRDAWQNGSGAKDLRLETERCEAGS